MERVINAGWVRRNGSVVDPSMLMEAGQGRQIVVNEGYDVNADIREISPPNVPPGWLQYQDILDKNIMEIPGASDELLGLSSTGDSQVSGKLAETRASNGLKGNRGIFDNLEQTQKYVGALVLECIQKQYQPGKIQRITKQELTEEFYSGQFLEYDCAIKQAVKTSTQREAYYYQLIQLKAMDAPIEWVDILEAAPLQGKTKLLENMAKAQEQQAEMAKQVHEAEQIQRALEMSQVDQNTALAEERRARVLADIGLARERISEGEQNYAKALLDNAKTVKEIQDLDRKRLIDVMQLAADMSQAQNAIAEKKLAADAKRTTSPITGV
jgi:hypothetical protein